MGSGFSACNGPATVEVRTSIGRHHDGHEGLALSDSHDSGISEVGRGHSGNVDVRDVERHFFESNQECPGTPRLMYGSGPRGRIEMAPTDLGNSYRLQLKRNPSSAPSLSEFAITEEDEESTPTRKRLARPKSANVRKRRGLKSGKRRPGIEKSRRTECPDHSSDATDSDIDSDDSNVISMPDETGQFQYSHRQGIDDDWWKLDSPLREYGVLSSRSYHDANIVKKASERSISSIILFDPDLYANTEWCFYTNPDAANIVKKNLKQVEDDLWCDIKRASEGCGGQMEDFVQIVQRYRPLLTRLVLEYRQAAEPAASSTGDLDHQKLASLENHFADRLFYRQATLTQQELSTLLAEHLQHIEEELEEDVGRTSHVINNGNGVLGACDVLPCATGGRWADGAAQHMMEAIQLEQLTAALALVLTRKRVDVTVEDLIPIIRSHYPKSEGVREANIELCKALVDKARKGDITNSDLRNTIENCLTASTPAARGRGVNIVNADVQSRRPNGHSMAMCSAGSSIRSSRPSTDKSLASTSLIQTKLVEMDVRQRPKVRPDSGVVVTSSSGSYSSSERSRDHDIDTASLDSSWISSSLQLLDAILKVRTEKHDTIKSLVAAVTRDCDTPHMKAHALYRWLAHQSLEYYSKTSLRVSSPTGKMKQLYEKKLTYASLYQEMARCAGLKCELVEGVAKHRDYLPGDPASTPACRHVWNAIVLDDQYRLLDVQYGSQPYKYFVEHFFLAPPDEFRLSHFPNDSKWLRMAQTITMADFEGTLKTWPAMFAFNIRPLSMKAVMRTYDGKLSVTVLLQNVAVTPTLQYLGPGPPQDSDVLMYHIDQEIRTMDNAETFHVNLPQEGTYYFTLLVHDLEEDVDIPALQYRIDYRDELL